MFLIMGFAQPDVGSEGWFCNPERVNGGRGVSRGALMTEIFTDDRETVDFFYFEGGFYSREG